MSSARCRLNLIGGHLHQSNEQRKVSEFPLLPAAEREKYINSVFHRDSVSSSTPRLLSLNSLNSNQGPVFRDQNVITATRKVSMVPGPVEISEAVRQSMSLSPLVHTSPEFVEIFHQVLKKLRILIGNNKETNGGQALVLSGSGTLGWDILGSNLINSSTSNILCISTGFFSDSMVQCLSNYVDNESTQVDILRPDTIGAQVPLNSIKKALASKKYDWITLTQTDTSTGVLTDVKAISELVHQVSPSTMIAIDGVCSVGVEEIQFDNWKLDYVLTASQKALSSPAGLLVSFLSQRAIDLNSKYKKKKPFYSSLDKWLPIMVNYENRKPSYFATPLSQLIMALNTSLTEILGDITEIDTVSGLPKALVERFVKHESHAKLLREKLVTKETGLKNVVVAPEDACSGMTALYVPEGTNVPSLLSHISSVYKINLAGGIHPQISTRYIRIGHMGISVTENDGADLKAVIEAIVASLKAIA